LLALDRARDVTEAYWRHPWRAPCSGSPRCGWAATEGRVEFDAEEITNLKPSQRAGHGLGRTFQNIRLFTDMNVLDNVRVGADRPGNIVDGGKPIPIATARLPWTVRPERTQRRIEAVDVKLTACTG
jgi:ABC-type branched-subunit amino acid transport system ATPase component